jgi:hypothetical protein
MGVNAHLFSQIVKARYFPSWGPAAGVGANFWAEGYALLGLAGVVAFALIIILSLRYLERWIGRTQSSAVRATLVACGVILAFYVHRNSVEQILAFVGRYATLGILVGLVARFAVNSVRSSERFAEPVPVLATTRFGPRADAPHGDRVKRHG